MYDISITMEEKSNYRNCYMQEELELEEEAEETLSLCDLPIYSAAESESLSKQDQTSFLSSSLSSSTDQEDLFEFFSQDWSISSSSTNSYPPLDSIVFCGKLIPSKQQPQQKPETAVTEPQQKPKAKRRLLLGWNLKLFSRYRYRHRCGRRYEQGESKASTNQQPKLKCGGRKGATKVGEKYGYSVRRVSVLAAPGRSRWHYLMMFGLAARPPAEMELGDIRSRQSRRSPSGLFGLSCGGDHDEKVGGGKWLWGLIRALGCGGHHSYVRT